MPLLSVGGVTNLGWVLLLTVGVLAEKTIPAGKALSNLIGVLLIIFGRYTFYGFFTKDTQGSIPSMAMNCMKMDGLNSD